jgi:hypothetical protein
MEFVWSGIRDQRHLCEMTLFGRGLYNELECVASVNESVIEANCSVNQLFALILWLIHLEINATLGGRKTAFVLFPLEHARVN